MIAKRSTLISLLSTLLVIVTVLTSVLVFTATAGSSKSDADPDVYTYASSVAELKEKNEITDWYLAEKTWDVWYEEDPNTSGRATGYYFIDLTELDYDTVAFALASQNKNILRYAFLTEMPENDGDLPKYAAGTTFTAMETSDTAWNKKLAGKLFFDDIPEDAKYLAVLGRYWSSDGYCPTSITFLRTDKNLLLNDLATYAYPMNSILPATHTVSGGKWSLMDSGKTADALIPIAGTAFNTVAFTAKDGSSSVEYNFLTGIPGNWGGMSTFTVDGSTDMKTAASGESVTIPDDAEYIVVRYTNNGTSILPSSIVFDSDTPTPDEPAPDSPDVYEYPMESLEFADGYFDYWNSSPKYTATDGEYAMILIDLTELDYDAVSFIISNNYKGYLGYGFLTQMPTVGQKVSYAGGTKFVEYISEKAIGLRYYANIPSGAKVLAIWAQDTAGEGPIFIPQSITFERVDPNLTRDDLESYDYPMERVVPSMGTIRSSDGKYTIVGGYSFALIPVDGCSFDKVRLIANGEGNGLGYTFLTALPTIGATPSYANGYSGVVWDEGPDVRENIANVPSNAKWLAVYYSNGDQNAFNSYCPEAIIFERTREYELEMLPEVEARLDGQSGLRFTTRIPTATLEALGGNYTIGTLIYPTDLLDTALTLNVTDAIHFTNLIPTVIGDYTYFYASIVNILPQNYARSFTAVSYIQIDGKTHYTSNRSRSMYDAASEAHKANQSQDNLRPYLDSIVEIDGCVQVLPYVGYDHPLTISIYNGILTVSSADGSALTANDLTAVILNGTVYTGGWTVSGGKLVMTANIEHVVEEGDGRIVTPPTSSKDGTVEFVCTLCGKTARTESISYSDYASDVDVLKSKIEAFKDSDFGSSSINKSLGTTYSTSIKITEGHPRVLFNTDDVAGINLALHDERSLAAAELLRGVVDTPIDELLPNGSVGFSEYLHNQIQLLALDYALTGNELSGYSAIYAIKYILANMSYDKSGMGDMYHIYYGYTMYLAACVYDWCNDLMTTTDRNHIVRGVQNKICKVIGDSSGAPSQEDSVTGHYTRYRILRDYLAFAIAIYDQYPEWWSYVGGRFYKQFVPVRSAWYEAGMVPQGVSMYVRGKYQSDLYSAWLIEAAGLDFPYNNGDKSYMMQVARTIFSYQLPSSSGRFGFNAGDDHATDGSFLEYGLIALYSSYLFDDETMRAQLESSAGSFTKFYDDPTDSSDHYVYASPAEYLICTSSGLKSASDPREDMPLILYNGGWLGQIIARDSWEKNQVAVLMKIGCRNIGNHDHLDAGQFQIYYKDMLAGDTGAYVDYGENHHKYYHQATIAHNSLLIYDPSKYSKYSSTKKYYTGGQKTLSDAGLSTWLTDSYKTGEVNGVSYGYADEEKTDPTYAYIAGDIAYAYDSSTVDEVTRRMLAVFDTDNPDVPMFFFVFDNITADNASFKKTFLLHTKTEPIISGNTKTVTTVTGGGKLVLQNVIGNNVSITGVGGSNNNYVVQSSQLAPSNGRSDGYWGRVEISPATGSKTDQLLNVMYVCDEGDEPNLVASPISTDSTDVVKGAQIGNTAAIFVVNKARQTSAFSFTSTGTETLNYYISGVAAGEWTVSVGGTTLTATATEEGGFLSFSAPAGTVTISPRG